MKLAKSLIAILLIAALSAIGGYLTGYNFDERNEFVASWYFLTILFALFAVAIINLHD